ncbi:MULTISPECIES: hypothetical protein [Bacillaceae]|uniref:hypothetical protein n=1 Tax=Bacillaceae TaxID=186817 RepID=UPI00036030DA|nr:MULTISPECIES: hypothetical protein [Bacillaceae]
MHDLIVKLGWIIFACALVLGYILSTGDGNSLMDSNAKLGEKLIQDVNQYTEP